VVVYAGTWFAEPALVAKEPFALDGRSIDGRGSVRVRVLFMRRRGHRSGIEQPRQRGLHDGLM
jgi:hypothetical protein